VRQTTQSDRFTPLHLAAVNAARPGRAAQRVSAPSGSVRTVVIAIESPVRAGRASASMRPN